MSKKLVALRYAKALVEIVEKENSLVATQRELDTIVNMVQSNKDLQILVFHPIFSPQKRANAFEAILQAANISLIVRNFFHVVTKATRLDLIYEIVNVYKQIVGEYTGTTEASVKTAHPLSKEQKETLIEVLAHKTNSKIKLKCQHDTSIIGGIKIQIGSVVYDASIKGRLSLLKAKLLLG